GQLTSVKLPNGRVVAYKYDAAGNRISVTDNAVITNYTINSLNQYTSVGGDSYSYDATGNLVAGGGNSYTYDAEGRLTGVTGPDGSWTYQSDAFGNRIATTHNGQTTRYLIDPSGL